MFSLSDTALHYLFKFFSTFLSLVANALPNPGLLTFSRYLPKTLDSARKIAKTKYDFYKVFAACPKCNKVYKLSQCIIRNRNGLETSKSCTYVEFPSHPWVTFRAPCGETLMKSVKSSSGKIFLYPKLSFCYLPLVDSLAIVLPRIKANLNHWKSRCIPRGLMADMYDGEVWKEFMRFDDERSSSVCLSLTLNVDWFEPYKYVKHSVGAMYVVINNLPRHLRFKASNVILVGLMPGPDLPYNINHYLAPLVDELKELAIGVTINGEVVRGMLSCIANDVPAARKVCGFASHNARLGCSRCLKVFPTEEFGDVPDYSGYDVSNWLQRTNEQVRSGGVKFLQAKTAQARKAVVRQFGCRYTILSELPSLNIVRNTIIDPMHNLFLGTAKHVLQAWKERAIIKDSQFSDIQHKVDNILVSRKVGRIPGKILHGFSRFTADQWKSWTLVFSIFCLHNVLPSEHLECWRLFVYACALYTSKVVTHQSIEEANQAIVNFCKKAEELYGKEFCTPNMHLHCHLIDCFKDYGPAHSYWLFTFERYNGILGDVPTNHRSITVQLMRKFTQYMHLTATHDKLPQDLRDAFSSFLNTDQSVGSLKASSDPTCATLQKIPLQTSKVGTVDFTVDDNTQLLPVLKETVLNSDQLQCLKQLYAKMFPNSRFCAIRRVVQTSARAISGDMLVSTNEVNEATSYIVAKWGLDEAEELMYGTIKMIFRSVSTISDSDGTKEVNVILAQVHWYKPHPCSQVIGFPWIICSQDVHPFSLLSFIPLSRIMSSCACTQYIIQPSDNTMYSNESVFAFAPVTYSFSEFVNY